MKKKVLVLICTVLLCCLFSPTQPILGATNKIKIPESVKDISRVNTYPNSDIDPEYVEPSSSTTELLKTCEYDIANPNLIRLLNESNIKTTKLSVGFHANIYLGNWALDYQSKETSVNWEYKEANLNKLDNLHGRDKVDLTYLQNEEYTVLGGLTTEVHAEEDVRKLMIAAAKKNTGLNLAFKSKIGKGTKHEVLMKVPVGKLGYLHAFVPAASERGIVTYGEVYLDVKGSQKKIIIKNVTQKGVGAWIPVQDKLSFKYMLSSKYK
ncbi:YfkD family protein [Bacillus horti]|uniref:YfkD-like protein n=1 Tax=Caldalkalibacillus horti TaxID=77523 RepID=A0ABT9VXU8_9BACI|nr:YfkD family protein [Bacillus horti]MDQ0165794.1 hypothetical protein [Bacillus horti]